MGGFTRFFISTVMGCSCVYTTNGWAQNTPARTQDWSLQYVSPTPTPPIITPQSQGPRWENLHYLYIMYQTGDIDYRIPRALHLPSGVNTVQRHLELLTFNYSIEGDIAVWRRLLVGAQLHLGVAHILNPLATTVGLGREVQINTTAIIGFLGVLALSHETGITLIRASIAGGLRVIFTSAQVRYGESLTQSPEASTMFAPSVVPQIDLQFRIGTHTKLGFFIRGELTPPFGLGGGLTLVPIGNF